MQSIGVEQEQDGTLGKISSEELSWRSDVLEDVRRIAATMRISPKP